MLAVTGAGPGQLAVLAQGIVHRVARRHGHPRPGPPRAAAPHPARLRRSVGLPAARRRRPLAHGSRVAGWRPHHRPAGGSSGRALGSRTGRACGQGQPFRGVRAVSSEDDVLQAADPGEPHAGASAGKLNWLRAGVLGANDGIVSVAGIVVGVAGATSSRGPVFTAGLAGLVAGAVSMALGEYVSVSSQRDSETSLLAQERRELADQPGLELAELAALYQAKGLSEPTARQVARELTEHDALAAHLDAELHIDPEDLARPVQAAAASAASFTSGALLPLLAILLPPVSWRIPVTIVAVLVALGVAGAGSARIGGSNIRRAVLRVVIGGAIGLAFTWGIGHLFGTAIG
ncbi:MAG: VIT family protein [Actinobacteria bacterium]|nr:VIT family protein [Actinomycetota bacterium]